MQISIIEPGGYNTKGLNNSYDAPPHPAYGKPNLPSFVARSILSDPNYVLPGDLNKGVAKIYELACLQNPPLRLPLGKDAVESVKAQLASVTAEVEKYESWSDNLALDKAVAVA